MSRILVVDDNALNLALARDLLELAGHRVVTAGSGAEALERVREEPPELVLMDLRMPVMDGIEAMRRLKADPLTRSIPVVVLTASAMKGEREALLARGFDGYISKPVDAARFADEVARHLPGGGHGEAPDDG